MLQLIKNKQIYFITLRADFVLTNISSPTRLITYVYNHTTVYKLREDMEKFSDHKVK